MSGPDDDTPDDHTPGADGRDAGTPADPSTSDVPDTGAGEPDPLSLAREIADSYRGTGAPARPRRRRVHGSTPTRRKGREDPSSVADALGDLVRQQGWDGRLSAQRVFTDWASIVGPEIATHSAVDGYADGIVHVKTDSTAWATQLRLLAPRLVARLNEELGDGSVLRIDVRGPQAPSWKRGLRSVKGRGPRDTYG
ncbi:DUF721 domain-containing protein [Aeromicrobium sp. 50.2.37]|uniref:DUF721 domain-containing protein n=1 Tax=Aeromicrobium sp. 50.2.37 TaxID=2969305 RepID=UPI00214F650C|nr:DciA family protein [Aeromicrobium sp. 50.2.37]MCR4513239.1 DciA family protein [Aeromicrobium sp. 50.2.37]